MNSGPGNQTNPHVDCDTASYTNDDLEGTSTIHYWNFANSTDHVIPGNGLDRLSDVSGNRIAFTELSATGDVVALYNTSTLTRIELPGTKSSNPALGGNLVAYEDRGYLLPPNQSEIDLYDLNTDSAIRLTNDTLFDKNPAVSPTGNAVVWEKCQTDGTGCDIYSAIQTGSGIFTTHALTPTTGEDRMPDTNGTLAVYVSNRSGENDVYYQAVAGGPETHLSIPGDQRDVAISGNLIAFESNAGGAGYDIYVYDVGANTLYRVTNTSGVDETLTDITVCNGTGRIVYAMPGNFGDFDVWAFTFTPPDPPPEEPPPGDDCSPAADACEHPTGRTLLAELTITRGNGHPQAGGTTFADPQPSALLCITNARATSGAVTINNRRVVGPSAFKHSKKLIALRVDGMHAVNGLEASIAGERGTSYTVKLYSDSGECHAPGCGNDNGGGWGHGHDDDHGHGHGHGHDAVLDISGERLTTADGYTQLQYDVNEPLDADAMGCSSTSGVALSGLVVLALWLASRRRPAAVRARRT